MRWRSMLFVPGNRPDLAAKTPRCHPDVVVIDLEDAAPPADKIAARASARESALDLMSNMAVCIRINPPTTEWFEGDIASLPDGLAGVVVRSGRPTASSASRSWPDSKRYGAW